MLDPVTVERALAAGGDKPIMVALSGGGDSVALLHLLHARRGADKLKAVIVDHALRAGSSADALRARDFAAALGVRAEIVALEWPGGPKRAQQAARIARYGALCGAARRACARVIALAHTADDQAETMMMRASAGSSWRGLAGIASMAPAPVWPEGRGIVLARPLLGARRDALRAYLQSQRADWIEDPANSNPAFERVRARARLAALEAAGFDPARLAALASRLRVHADALDAAAAALIARAARFEGEMVLVDRAHWCGDVQTRRRALSVLVTAAAGAAREPSPSALARLEARVVDTGFRGGALGGACLSPSGEGVRITRDPGAVVGRAGIAPDPPLPLAPDMETVWDGRLALCAREPGWTIAAGPGGPALRRGGGTVPLRDWAGSAEWLVSARTHALLGQGG